MIAFEGEAKDESGNYVLSGTKDPSIFGKGDGWKEKLKRINTRLTLLVKKLQ